MILKEALKEWLIKDEETYILTNELNYCSDVDFKEVFSANVYSKAKGKDIKKAIEMWDKKEILLKHNWKEVYETVSALENSYVFLPEDKTGNKGIINFIVKKVIIKELDLVKYILKYADNPKYIYNKN